ncbi:hypothetical protein HPB50_022702 [Hyalomma asiaticum]|uniref:Uncharacterized protein n=1 Tax=Hyalomma asiaticum TaxID=266040 RepID=A0ACB7SYB3_HYAAI|nr:hypothetical protein HPB50_022702 [Hyalomma asiaticum]
MSRTNMLEEPETGSIYHVAEARISICCAIQRIGTTTAIGSKERRHEPYDRQRVLRHMSAADSAQRSDVPQQATNVLKPATLVLNAAANGSAPSANMDDAGESEAKKLRVDEDKTSTYDAKTKTSTVMRRRLL